MAIGFVGLGTMGAPMARNLIAKSGQEVHVYDVVKERVEELAAQGAKGASSLAEVARASQVVFTMVPDGQAVASVLEAMLPELGQGKIVCDMSTIAPEQSRQLAAQAREVGASFLDAPVVKSQPAAVKGELGIYVGGDGEVFARIQPLLACMGNNIIHLGSNGQGLVMKLCHNALVGQIQNGVNETLSLAKQAGIEVADFIQAISYGGGQNFYLDVKGQAIAKEDWTPAFTVRNMHKDMNLASQLARELIGDLPGISLVRDRYQAAMERGYADEDFSATLKLLQRDL
jgi:3-hydroxyisobutyrate dehydrogenase